MPRVMVRMARGPASMNVPQEKVQTYLQAGWIEVDRYTMTEDAVAVIVTPLISPPLAVTKKAAPKKAAK